MASSDFERHQEDDRIRAAPIRVQSEFEFDDHLDLRRLSNRSKVISLPVICWFILFFVLVLLPLFRLIQFWVILGSIRC